MGITLAASESMIMKCLWDANQDLTVVELVDRLKIQYGKEYAVNTVSTFMTILMKKGFVTRYKTKHSHQYKPLITKEEYTNGQANSMKDEWYGGSVSGVMAALFKTSNISEEEIKVMRAILDEYSN